ncbi:MAG TPA: Crp/Fnr family transcriptional regulator [Acetobacteraceae bacterium]|nr:Crp/Fnr family transcriptional regulator [Acetobacteraceae bacterium]
MALTPAQTAVLEQLRQHALLRWLAEDDLGALVGNATVRVFDQRAELFAQGDEARSVLVMVHGFVKLSAVTAGGRDVVLDLVGPGDVFGELGVLTQQSRAATATALTPCSVLSIDGRAFLTALGRAPEAMFWVIRLLGRRLNKATQQMTDGLELPAPARLAKALLELAALQSQATTDGLQISLKLSQRELGAMTGLIRESINKHLGLWREAGWLSQAGRTITLHNLSALRRLVAEQSEG